MKITSKKTTDNTKTKKWSTEVTEDSDALDLKENIFESKQARKIAESLKRFGREAKPN